MITVGNRKPLPFEVLWNFSWEFVSLDNETVECNTIIGRAVIKSHRGVPVYVGVLLQLTHNSDLISLFTCVRGGFFSPTV